MTELEAARANVMNSLLMAILGPSSIKFDQRSAIQFVQVVLLNHAWCIREQLLDNILTKEEITRDVILTVRSRANEERRKHNATMEKYAQFLAETLAYPIPTATQ